MITKFRKNDGFTLVELMIVLSIIAILAVVLVPRVGSMKDSVREQGAVANVNSVRAYLELRVNDRDDNTTTGRDALIDDMGDEFVDGNAIVNPFSSGEDIEAWSERDETSSAVVVSVETGASYSVDSVSTDTDYTGDTTYVPGLVVIVICSDGYAVFGIDADGTPIDYFTVE